MTSPFASASWEPRFVVEHYDEVALRHAIALWERCRLRPFQGPVQFVARAPALLRVAQPGDREPFGEWERLDPPLRLDELSTWIMDWLATATYDPQPNFDGSEAAGFVVYWKHYGYQETPPRPGYGELVVAPKWFEIHK